MISQITQSPIGGIMNEQLEERLKALEAEFETGKKMLAELEAKESALRGSLLRISGAIQVLREFVPEADAAGIPEEPQKTAAIAN
jgi:predicted nuclease with TOPRIM domain